MAETFNFLTVSQAIEAAAALRQRLDTYLDPRRAVTEMSISAIASVAVLVEQLDAIAQASARTEDTWRRANEGQASAQDAADAAVDLIRLLSAAGYLPLPPALATEEAAHAQG